LNPDKRANVAYGVFTFHFTSPSASPDTLGILTDFFYSVVKEPLFFYKLPISALILPHSQKYVNKFYHSFSKMFV